MSRKRFYRLIFDINYWNNLTNNRRPSIIHQPHLFPPLKSIPENMLTSRLLTNILTFSIHKFSVQERLVFPSRVSLGCPLLVSTLLNHKPDEGPLSTTNGDAGSTRSFVFPKVWIDVCACLFTWRERHHHLYGCIIPPLAPTIHQGWYLVLRGLFTDVMCRALSLCSLCPSFFKGRRPISSDGSRNPSTLWEENHRRVARLFLRILVDLRV